jgi:putative hydrolase of the HAD superfamily
MVSAVLFDFGGTLDADGLHWLDRFYGIYDRVGLSHIPKPLIKEAFYWADAQADEDVPMKKAGLREMMDRHTRWQFEKLGLTDTELQARVSEGFYKPCERVLRRNRRVLEKLSQAGLKMGVISNFYGNVEVLCQEFSYGPFLQVVLDSIVVGFKKPDPKIFELALEKLGVAASEAAMVGDSFERDIVPAKALGMKTFWLTGAELKQPPIPGQADVILRSLEELPDYLPELKERQPA